MSDEIVALINGPALIAALVTGAFLGSSFERERARMRRRAWRRQQQRRTKETASIIPLPTRIPSRSFDAAAQLRIVMDADFSIQPLLNKGEARVFRELDRMVLACNPNWQVMAQVSLGEILRSKQPDAYSCINSKRVDLLLVDENCHPRHVIEYQGAGHHQGTAAARDAVKKEALRRAGISYHEVVAGQTTPSDLRRLIERLVERPDAAAPPGDVRAETDFLTERTALIEQGHFPVEAPSYPPRTA